MEVTHIPKGSMCSNCQHILVRNCSHLDFASMPQIEKNKDGVVVVKCGDFVKFESNQDAWPEDISDHPHNPTIIQGGVVDKKFKRIQLALKACEGLTDEELEKGKFSELIAQREELISALKSLLEMSVKGHQLQDRMQFNENSRSILQKCYAAINEATDGQND